MPQSIASLDRRVWLTSLIAAVMLSSWGTPHRICGEEPAELRRLPPVDGILLPSTARPEFVEPGTASPSLAPADAMMPSAPSSDTDQAVAAEEASEAASPLATEPAAEHWYDWSIPSSWRLPEVWESSFELGIDGSEGNSTTLTFRSGAKLRRQVEGSDLKLALTYVKATAEYLETKHNAQLEAQHDWLLGDSPWSLFAKSIVVYDEFRPFDLELTLNSGVGYRFVKTDAIILKGRVGSGTTRQFGGPDNTWRPEAMLGLDFEYKISDRQKFHATSEYYPEWGDFESFRIRTDAGWELLVNEATNMSLKLGIIDRYDSEAGGLKPNALDYSLLLLWKL